MDDIPLFVMVNHITAASGEPYESATAGFGMNAQAPWLISLKYTTHDPIIRLAKGGAVYHIEHIRRRVKVVRARR